MRYCSLGLLFLPFAWRSIRSKCYFCSSLKQEWWLTVVMFECTKLLLLLISTAWGLSCTGGQASSKGEVRKGASIRGEERTSIYSKQVICEKSSCGSSGGARFHDKIRSTSLLHTISTSLFIPIGHRQIGPTRLGLLCPITAARMLNSCDGGGAVTAADAAIANGAPKLRCAACSSPPGDLLGPSGYVHRLLRMLLLLLARASRRCFPEPHTDTPKR